MLGRAVALFLATCGGSLIGQGLIGGQAMLWQAGGLLLVLAIGFLHGDGQRGGHPARPRALQKASSPTRRGVAVPSDLPQQPAPFAPRE